MMFRNWYRPKEVRAIPMDILFVIEAAELQEFQKLEQAQRGSCHPYGYSVCDRNCSAS